MNTLSSLSNETASKTNAWWLALLLVLALVLNFSFIDWGLPNHYTWGPDEVHPYLVLDGMKNRFSDGWYGKYPPLHYMITALVYLPVLHASGDEEVEALFQAVQEYFEDFNPNLDEIDPYLNEIDTAEVILNPSYPFKTILSVLSLVNRALNALMTTLIVLVIYGAGKEYFGARAGLWAAFLVITHPIIVFYGHTMNTEAPMFLWMALTLYYYIRALKRQDLCSHLGLGFFAALATATKDQSLGLIALLPPVLLFARAASRSGKRPNLKELGRALLDKNILGGAIVFITVFVLGTNLLFNWQGYQSHLKLNTPGLNMLERVYPLTVQGSLEYLWATLVLLNRTVSWGISALCVIGFIAALRAGPQKALALALPAVSYFAVFMMYIGFLTPRYVTPLFLVMAFFGGKCIADFLALKGLPRMIRLAPALVLAGYLLWLGGGTDLLLKDDPRYEAEAWFRENIPYESTTCFFSDLDHSLCRLPRGRTYVPTIHWVDCFGKLDKLMIQTKADYFMMNVFPDQVDHLPMSVWLPPIKSLCKKAGFQILALFEPAWPHPAWDYLYLSPHVIIGGRKSAAE
ncbi:MAG: glycosyltransferase family 39 protein [Planctomycetes bacterium]|nr:glycosyltransferase family 39 protein [Planctomycetota bacterium]